MAKNKINQKLKKVSWAIQINLNLWFLLFKTIKT